MAKTKNKPFAFGLISQYNLSHMVANGAERGLSGKIIGFVKDLDHKTRDRFDRWGAKRINGFHTEAGLSRLEKEYQNVPAIDIEETRGFRVVGTGVAVVNIPGVFIEESERIKPRSKGGPAFYIGLDRNAVTTYNIDPSTYAFTAHASLRSDGTIDLKVDDPDSEIKSMDVFSGCRVYISDRERSRRQEWVLEIGRIIPFQELETLDIPQVPSK